MPTNKRTKRPADLRSLARSYGHLGIEILAGIAQHSEDDGARVRAVSLLFDRGWGKPAQPHVGAEGEDIRVTIRTIVEGSVAPKR